MKESSIDILVLHAVILAIQFGLARMFPSQKRAVVGIYFILLPVGFLFFTPLPPAAMTPLVLGGLVYVFYCADRAASRPRQAEMEAGREG